MAQQTEHIGETNKTMTAVEWLWSELTKAWYDEKSSLSILKKAKAMEKEQIINSFGVGCQVESKRLIGYHGMAEEYYNEIYNK